MRQRETRFVSAPPPPCPAARQHPLQIHYAIQQGPAKQQRLDREARIYTPPDTHLVVGQESKHPYYIARLELVAIPFQRATKCVCHALNWRAYLKHEKASQRLACA